MRQNEGPIEVTMDNNMRRNIIKILSYRGSVKHPPEVIIESGTYLGTGTTKEFAELILKSKKIIPFYTIEGKWWVYEQAKKNLEKYSFIQPLYGLSLELQECLDFISNDDMIKNHYDWPDIFIDCTRDPVNMYRTEIWSCFADNPNPPPTGILYDLIPLNRHKHPIIVLDSCGGIGYLEFIKVKQLMGNNHYYLFCDDKGHIKNWRTYQDIIHDSNWKLLGETDRYFLAEFGG